MVLEVMKHTLLLSRHGVFAHLTDSELDRLEFMLHQTERHAHMEGLIDLWRKGDYLSLSHGTELFFRTNMLLMSMGRSPIDAVSGQSMLEAELEY